MTISIDRESESPLYAQIRDALQADIQNGTLNPGDRLPTVTALAKQLGVTQATIRRAFEDLSKAGHIESYVGRGTFVSDPDAPSAEDTNHGQRRSRISDAPQTPESALAARRLRMGISRSLQELVALAKRPGLIRFTSGIPAPDTVQDGLLEQLAQDALKAGQRAYLEYADPLGIPELRQELSRHFQTNNLQVSPDQILITSGSQQAVALLAQWAFENHQRIICETPNYRGVTDAFGAFGHWVETVVRDADGPIPERLERFSDGVPSLFYCCPELHNPMGTDLSADRREFLVEWARAQHALLVTDQIYHDLRFNGPSPVDLFTEIGAQNMVMIGSLSKSFMCGLRIGWLVTSAERIRALSPLKRVMDIACPPLMQGIAVELLRSGEYVRHITRVREHYRIRRDATLEAFERFMPDGVTWTVPEGGFQLWAELPAGYSSIALFLLAIERGVAFIPGPLQDINHRFMHAFRFCYGSVSVEQIAEGIELLADAVNELLRDPPGESGLSGLGDFQ
jgi:DNA-binding transcriptional MocR family regulator